MAEYPAIEVHLEGTNRRVDVIAEGFDIAIRVRFPPLASSDLVMRQLDVSTQCLVASPALIAVPLSSPADLAGLPSLDLGPAQREHSWQLRHEDGRTATVRHTPRLVTDDMSALRDAAYAGVGIVQLPMMMIWEDLAERRLIEVLPGWHLPAGIVHATFASRRGLLPSVRALLDFLVRECAAQRVRADRSLGMVT
jgi:DNA-binding transcriptional LysR family regulator